MTSQDNAGLLLGVDIGGTKIAIAAIDRSGIVDKRVIPTPREGWRSVFEAIIETGQQVIRDVGGVAGIGVGVPGPIDFAKGEVIFAPNIPGFEHAPVRAALSEGFGVEIELENDANAAGLAEHTLGAAREASSSVFITVSTGIGGGIILNDKVWRGAHGIAGEIGHATILPGGTVAGSAVDGALEAVASGSAIARDGSYAFGRPLETAEVFVLAREGDRRAVRIIENAARYLGLEMANLQKVIDPEMFVLGGSVATSNTDFVAQAVQVAEAYTIGFAKPTVRIAELGTDAGVIGAALAARR